MAGSELPPALWPGRVIRLRRAANVVNLATPLGLLVALAGRARLSRGPHGLVLAKGFRLPMRAPALTIGDVVLIRVTDDVLERRPRLLDHEARHAIQYACCLGPVFFLPAYGLAAAWSWARTRNPGLRNVFEVRAGLHDGGYLHRQAPPPRGRGGAARR